jgi:hypothetical protein
MKKVGSFIFFLFLLLATYVNAQPSYTVWSGTVSCPLKITETYDDPSGNTKFKTHTESFTGELRFFIGEEGPVPNEAGHYLELLDEGKNLIYSVNQIAAIRTKVKKSKTDQVLLIGIGDFFFPEPDQEGIAYVDATGTLKKDTSGEMTSISLKGQIAGGAGGDFPFIFSCNFRTILTKAD